MINTKEMKYGKMIETKIFFIKQLQYLGINCKYMGFYSLIEILEILVNTKRVVKSFSREVYPEVAQKYGKTVCTIERNIRSLIMKSWSVDLMQKLQKYYPESFKPTCRDFIFMIKNYISNQII